MVRFFSSFYIFDIGDVYSKVPLKSVKSEVFDKLVEDTRNFLMDNLVNKFNLLFNETWTPSSMCITNLKIVELHKSFCLVLQGFLLI